MSLVCWDVSQVCSRAMILLCVPRPWLPAPTPCCSESPCRPGTRSGLLFSCAVPVLKVIEVDPGVRNGPLGRGHVIST
jgi:hypothetical protein